MCKPGPWQARTAHSANICAAMINGCKCLHASYCRDFMANAELRTRLLTGCGLLFEEVAGGEYVVDVLMAE